VNVTQILDLEPPPGLERLLAQTHAGKEALWAELDRERSRLDDFACRAGVRPDLVRRFVAVGLLTEGSAGDSAVPGSLRGTQESVTVGLLLDVLDRLEALRTQLAPPKGSPWT
jgi:hypothetical protein